MPGLLPCLLPSADGAGWADVSQQQNQGLGRERIPWDPPLKEPSALHPELSSSRSGRLLQPALLTRSAPWEGSSLATASDQTSKALTSCPTTRQLLSHSGRMDLDQQTPQRFGVYLVHIGFSNLSVYPGTRHVLSRIRRQLLPSGFCRSTSLFREGTMNTDGTLLWLSYRSDSRGKSMQALLSSPLPMNSSEATC